ncbi:hypothetical protein D3880_15205 [Pseudomonas cavernae]|uniref:Uncharacterized protein n=1 Tax=Pseudomonas cavernae TaxID=2320867 RepID=A0A385Z7Y7_9PSED|nr:hypothetical protein [Pseudomonas cavernae]AYC33622.1 hypothetical protein D3880_15205 [Pseudomonas cavernae]
MKPQQQPTTLDDDICVHIFSASAAMVGVCITVIGILQVVLTLRKVNLLGDDLLAANAMIYLAAALIAYWSLRTRKTRRNYRIERVADALFLIALVFTAVNAGFITWTVSAS